MRRRTIRAGLVTAVVGLVALVPLGATAGGGGGCHAGMTQGTGDRVDMVKACFTPSILQVDPGTEVTFTNKDPLVHNVSAAYEWGHYEDMMQGDSFTATFTDEGIYPFACNYHAGMTGAVVVGDGQGPGSGVKVGGASSSERQPKAAPAAASSEASPTAVGWIGGGLAGLLLGAVLGRTVRRRPGA
jgi:plastocyanin